MLHNTSCLLSIALQYSIEYNWLGPPCMTYSFFAELLKDITCHNFMCCSTVRNVSLFAIILLLNLIYYYYMQYVSI